MLGNNYLERSKRQSKTAFDLIKQGKVTKIWQEAGADIHLVGSLKIGVMAKHRDIDFHIYTDKLDLSESFGIIAKICENLDVQNVSFTDLSKTPETCFEWHIWALGSDRQYWQIDLIQILRGSEYDGYFENVAKQIRHSMTKAQRETILKLKFETPNNMKISGIEYYKAVIQNGILDFDEFCTWRQKQNFSGIIEW